MTERCSVPLTVGENCHRPAGHDGQHADVSGQSFAALEQPQVQDPTPTGD